MSNATQGAQVLGVYFDYGSNSTVQGGDKNSGIAQLSDIGNKTLSVIPTRVTDSQIVSGSSVFIKSIECISGTSVSLTLYDNQNAAAGVVLYSQTMSAGDKAYLPSAIKALFGVCASFTGTATFDIGVHNAS